MGLAAFAALLRLVDGAVVGVVPLGPEPPPNPLTVHGQVDELACSATGTAGLVLKGSGFPGDSGQTLHMFATGELSKHLDF